MTSIKRGVSLYSLQDAYGRGGLGLEGTIAAVEQMGTQGIEFLSDQMLTGAQNASENTLREWDAIIERHPLDLVSNDIFVNSTLYRNRTLTLEEQAELLSSDLRLANRLGFRLVRVVSRTDPRLIKMTVDLAEKLDVTPPAGATPVPAPAAAGHDPSRPLVRPNDAPRSESVASIWASSWTSAFSASVIPVFPQITSVI